jgi:hypothetical protein
MARELEPWGGEVRVPRWLRRLLRRRPEPDDTPERAREPKHAQSDRTVLENANRAATGAVVDVYQEGRDTRRRGTSGSRGD